MPKIGAKKVRQSVGKTSFPPALLVQLLEPGQWENFIEDCCRTESKYVLVQRLGGAGDAGRDVEARYTQTLMADQWDLFQAKRYQTAVGEGDLYPELAKVFHHLAQKTYPTPKNYYICAPKNTTPMLHDLIAKPIEMKQRFLKAWADGKMGISVSKFPLSPATATVVDNFDFGKIKEYPVKDLLELHERDKTKHEKLFGVEATRDASVIPNIPTAVEQNYLEQILKVYAEDGSVALTMAEALLSDSYSEHLQSCRAEFYSADGLQRFSRDIYPGEFDNFKVAVYNGVRRVASSPTYKTGMSRMNSVLDFSMGLKIEDSPLAKRLLPADLPGTCHHLVNEKKIKWVK
ncbi:restriction endonuclease [Janthinobacterium lividum]|uniref:ABC-three component system protein n=1 Tax=Janthinobacterium lividum TaxID=29581 RepID=UPI001595642F|nr:ABC-three component system protein [Janthinobacterium lividum]QKY02000.1 restriction endonuclease [Janthinobacterium lividum]